jgi:serine/threonine protein kinase
MALSSGSRLGPYEIQSPLGAGGMGEVYRARDTRLDRVVAVKILPEHLSSSAELKTRFEREARAVSSLNHPHICHLYDVGTQEGTSFLVMEYLEGESLADRLRKGGLPLKQALAYGIQIADALAAAHRAGILHRDLKPGNVMLTSGGAKLLDFGLAKTSTTLSGSAAAISSMTPSTPTMTIAELSSKSKDLTQRGTIVGTFRYMSPEVLQGAEADARSDVFSLGCVLYEMVTGRKAFEGKSQLSVLTAILEKDPDSIQQMQPTSPAALDHVVRGCLEKDPSERLQTAQDVKLELKWIAETGAEAKVPRVSRGGFWPWIAAAGAFALGLVLATAYGTFNVHQNAVLRSSILAPAGTSFVTLSPESGPPEISPDGVKIAFSGRDDKGNVMLYIRALNSLTADLRLGTNNASYPFWSPDSREVGFFADGKLKSISLDGWPPQIICDVNNARGGSWSKEGVIVFAPGTGSNLMRVSPGGGTPEPASRLDLPHAENSHRWPYFLPDGSHFLFWARNSRGVQEHTLYVGTLGSLDAKPLMRSELMARYSQGYLLFMRDRTLMAQPFDANKIELKGSSVPIAEHIATNTISNRPVFSASEDGTLLYQTGSMEGGWRLLWFTRDGKQSGALGELDRYFDPAISPDGKRVAAGLLTSQGIIDIWIFDLARGTKTRLTFGPSVQRFPVWSPDGKTIYYASNGKGSFQMFSKPADGSGPEQPVLQDNDIEFPRGVSPDQRYLVFTHVAVNKGRPGIWALPLFGDRKTFIVVESTFDNNFPTLSPDGKWVAYENNESGPSEIYVTAFPGGGVKWQVSTNGGARAEWRSDGKELYFLDAADNVMACDVKTDGKSVQFGTPHLLFRGVGVQNQQGPYAVSSDGKLFLMNSGDLKEENQPLILVQNWARELKK